MSIEKYLNEIDNEVAVESTGVDIIAMLLAVSGYVGYQAYKKIKEERKRKLVKEKENGEFKKKKEEYLSKNSHTKDSIINAMQNDVKKMVNKAKTDKSILGKMKADVEREAEKWELTTSEKKFSLTYIDYGDCIEIIDGMQEVHIILSWFIDDMATVLHEKYSDAITYGLVTVGTGDGDEGCIYIE